MEHDTFIQYVADNVDHNVRTLTGKGSFHAMGIIAVTSNQTRTISGNIQRLKERMKAETCTKKLGIKITAYNRSFNSIKGNIYLKNITMEEYPKDSIIETQKLLWDCGWFFSNDEKPRPHWSGFMQKSISGTAQFYTKSNVEFLPIINLNPNDMDCVYLTLNFVMDQAVKCNVKNPCLTFDQPLWLKATAIIETEKLPIICRLGGFHMLMSFLGSVGYVMKGSGLEQIFEEVYSPISVEGMISGKNVPRAVRAHIMVRSALMSLLLNDVKSRYNLDITFLENIYNKCVIGDLDDEAFSEISSSTSFSLLLQKLAEVKDILQSKSRTSKLFLRYIDYINTVMIFIAAERTSNWHLHLYAVGKMLNLFAATGHSNYAKCGRYYLQKMQELPQTHPHVYRCFLDGKHTVKRTEGFWKGLWTDLCIEQTLMRSIKTQGGLTQCRGTTETVHNLWLASLSYLAVIYSALMDLTGTQNHCEDHVELGKARIKTDYRDFKAFYSWLNSRNPFLVEDKNLHSLSTGLVSVFGQDDVSCERAEEIGLAIQESFNNQAITNCSIKRSKIVVPMTSLYKINKRKLAVEFGDNQTLFNRLITVADRFETLEEVFKFELTTEPMALFKHGMMRKADKPSLRRVLLNEKHTIPLHELKMCNTTIVDGGALLYRVRWAKGMQFNSIANLYISYIEKNYKNSIIIFDGYKLCSIKDHEHTRRYSVPLSSFVGIDKEFEIPYTQDHYFSLKENKVEFVRFISSCLIKSGIKVINCDADADSKIVSVAINEASTFSSPVLVVADDTDVAVMLLYHWKQEYNDIYFFQQRTNQVWSIMKSNSEFKDIKGHLLFIHAFSGCDTTSSMFGKGKSNIVKILRKSLPLQQASTTISNILSCQADIETATATAFKVIYRGQSKDSLTKIR